jgi:CubicO group peptidase (beta-lactamase class C family)
MASSEREARLKAAWSNAIAAAEYHRKTKDIKAGMALGMVTESGLVHSQCWGPTDVNEAAEKQVKVTKEHVFRIGSISKLFTDIAVMRLVEAGKLDLDVPVTQYIPSFKPKSKNGVAITLRNLMSHHSGLPREPMRGNYLDTSETTLEATVNSLNQMNLVLEPNTCYKYSNAGIGLVGRVLEVVSGEPFADHVQRMLEQDLNMKSTSFLPKPELMKSLCNGYMWNYEDRREQSAPMFELGEAPAGSMFSNIEDMANFIACLINRGTYGNKTILSHQSMQEMWRQQFADAPIGLGFVSMKKHGVQMVGHGGAIYGYCAELVVIPELQIGFISMLALDSANPVLSHINMCGLHGVLFDHNSFSAPFPPHQWLDTEVTVPIPEELFREFEGLYVQAHRLDDKLKMSRDDSIEKEAPHTWIYFFATKRRLQVLFNHMRINVRGIKHQIPTEKIPSGLSLVRVSPDDRLMCGQEDSVYFDIYYHTSSHKVDHIRFCNHTYKRSSETTLTPRTQRRFVNHESHLLEPFVGEYGPPHNPTFVYIRENQLVVQVEWFCISIVEKIGPNLFRFEDDALYSHESIRFERDASKPESAPATAIILCDHLRYPRVTPRQYSVYDP